MDHAYAVQGTELALALQGTFMEAMEAKQVNSNLTNKQTKS